MSEAAVRERVRESAAVVGALADGEHAAAIAAAAAAIADSYRAGGKVILFGNGGSAAEAQHVAGELVGRYLKERSSLAAIALADNTAALSALGNDYGYEETFARQLEAFGREGDVAVALTTSGGSENVVRALRAARGRGLVTVVLTGADGGAAGELGDHSIRVPSSDTPRIQEAHTLVCHVICELVEATLFP